jgi:predicted choloylglycine hydrolase
MRFNEFKGSPKEIGYQRGSKLKDILLSRYQLLWQGIEKSKSKVEKILQKARSTVEKFFPDFAQEMKATAEGAKMSYDHIVFLNLYEEMHCMPLNCSQIAFIKSDMGPIYGKSEDADYLDRNYGVTIIRPNKGHSFIEMGGIDWIVSAGGGINDTGLCIGQSTVVCSDINPDGVPRLTLLRAVLQNCSNVKEAIEFLRSYKINLIGMNYLLVDSEGEAAVVEKSPFKQRERYPEDNAVYCTNLFLHKEMEKLIKPGFYSFIETNAKDRYSRLKDFADLNTKAQNMGEGFKNILRSHGKGGICQHGSFNTASSFVMIPKKKEMWITDGPPCKNEFIVYKL